MKKLLSTLLCLSAITGIVPTVTSAVSEPIFIEDGAENWSKTVISGDINDDEKLNIADAVILQQCLMNSYSPDNDSKIDRTKLDINFDGSFDIFDFVQMRQYIIHPENAPTQTLAIDHFESDITFGLPIQFEDFNKVFTTYDDMSAYLSTIMSDNDEIQQFLDRYNPDFFEENNLILEPFMQNFGDGVFYEIAGMAKGKNERIKDQTFSGIAFVLNSNYEQNEGLYPQKKTNLLAQISVPKSQSCADDMVFYFDASHFFGDPQESICHYTDGTHELVFVYNSGLHHSTTEIYIKNPDGSFAYVADMFDFDFDFENNGELSGDNYNIIFRDDYFIIDYLSNGQWCKIQSSYES